VFAAYWVCFHPRGTLLAVVAYRSALALRRLWRKVRACGPDCEYAWLLGVARRPTRGVGQPRRNGAGQAHPRPTGNLPGRWAERPTHPTSQPNPTNLYEPTNTRTHLTNHPTNQPAPSNQPTSHNPPHKQRAWRSTWAWSWGSS
jgi:hypothetical protein